MLRVEGDDRLKAVVLAYKLTDRELRRVINTATRETIGPVWTQTVSRLAVTPQDRRVLATGARVKPGNPPVAVAATSTRRLSGGMTPATDWPLLEFGTADREKRTRYRARSKHGKSYPVTRRTRHQLPRRNASGRVIYGAFREVAPRAAALWVQIVVKAYNDAARKGG